MVLQDDSIAWSAAERSNHVAVSQPHRRNGRIVGLIERIVE